MKKAKIKIVEVEKKDKLHKPSKVISKKLKKEMNISSSAKKSYTNVTKLLGKKPIIQSARNISYKKQEVEKRKLPIRRKNPLKGKDIINLRRLSKNKKKENKIYDVGISSKKKIVIKLPFYILIYYEF